VIETYRMLGKQREDELLREARRLHAGREANASGSPRLPRPDTLRRPSKALLTSLRGAVFRTASTSRIFSRMSPERAQSQAVGSDRQISVPR
jgi:hypothetical protein